MNPMNLVTFEQAKVLKQLGCDIECNTHYMCNKKEGKHRLIANSAYNTRSYRTFYKNNMHIEYFFAPSVSEALQWIRDEKGIVCYVRGHTHDTQYHGKSHINDWLDVSTDSFDTYPLAESALLDQLLTYLKEKK